MFEHVLRADYEDPMKQVTFEPFTNIARGTKSKRIGKPRQHWTKETFNEAYYALDIPEAKDETGQKRDYKQNK